MRDLFDYQAKPENQRLRFAVLDVPSGQIGAIDVPAHLQRYGALPAATVPGDTPTGSAAPSSGLPPTKQATPVITKLSFRAGGAASSLDWSGGSLSYHGDIGIDQGAPAFFKSAYGAKFHCDSGKLVANDPASGARPNFLLTFQSASGTGALVELGGDAPAYSGNLPVDASARAFFDYLWKLCHCQQP
jgi:hypothetical protein